MANARTVTLADGKKVFAFSASDAPPRSISQQRRTKENHSEIQSESDRSLLAIAFAICDERGSASSVHGAGEIVEP